MGGLLSKFKQNKQKEPAASAVDLTNEQERGQEATPLHTLGNSGRATLHQAVEAGDEAEVWRLLAGGASVRVAEEGGRTPLMVAAGKGNTGMCELLIDAGADVGARDCDEQTALHIAAGAEGSEAVLELLLRRGADPHVQNGWGCSALHCALQSRNLAAVKVLVHILGPQLQLQRDDTGRTELHWAAANGTPQLVRQLIAVSSEGGVERDDMGMTPLARALQARNRETAGVLVAEACPSESAAEADAFGRTVLHWAAFAGYPEVVRQLLERGFSPWVQDQSGKDALMLAVESVQLRIVEEILQKGDYRECVDGKGQTALHVAAIRGDAAVVRRLLYHDADTGRQDSVGMTPLMYALRGRHRDVASQLMSRGQLNLEQLGGGRTLLHWAAVGGDADYVRQLLAQGAAVNAVDGQRKTAAALAVEHCNHAAAAALVRAGGFRVLRDREGRTPLHRAAAAGWSQLCMQLISLGADPQEEANDHATPIMEAMRSGHYTLARAMLQAWRRQQQQ